MLDKGLYNAEDKVIVFSMWTGMLDLIEVALVNSSIGYQRLDGSHRQEARREAIQQMRDDPENRVFLVKTFAFLHFSNDHSVPLLKPHDIGNLLYARVKNSWPLCSDSFCNPMRPCLNIHGRE